MQPITPSTGNGSPAQLPDWRQNYNTASVRMETETVEGELVVGLCDFRLGEIVVNLSTCTTWYLYNLNSVLQTITPCQAQVAPPSFPATQADPPRLEMRWRLLTCRSWQLLFLPRQLT